MYYLFSIIRLLEQVKGVVKMIHKEDKTQEQSLNEVEWTTWSQSLRGWISEHFGFAETQPLKEAALNALNFVESKIAENQLLSAIEKVNGVANFVDFLLHLGLISDEEIEEEIDEVSTKSEDLAFYHFILRFFACFFTGFKKISNNTWNNTFLPFWKLSPPYYLCSTFYFILSS